jgi:thiol-disulfide isomerase/thioredoxin
VAAVSSVAPAVPQVVELNQLQGQLAGQPVAYQFTATGCALCAHDASELLAAASNYGAVKLVGVDVVGNDSPAALASFLSSVGLGSSRFVWTIDSTGSLTQRFKVVSLGSSVIVDRTGNVRFTNQGPTDAATLSQQLRQVD